MRILIVEDDPYTAFFLEETLRELGHEVVGSLEAGLEAIEVAPGLRPDLVLMDVKITGEPDGVMTAMRLRQDFNIPSLFVTGRDDAETRQRAAKARPVGFAVKPLLEKDIEALLVSAGEQIGSRRS